MHTEFQGDEQPKITGRKKDMERKVTQTTPICRLDVIIIRDGHNNILSSESKERLRIKLKT